MAREGLASRLYRGEVSYDFIGKRKRWYILSGALMLISLVALLTVGLNPSIDFKGGDVFQFDKGNHSQQDVRDLFGEAGVTPEVVQTTGIGQFRVETAELSQSANSTEGDEVGKIIDKISTDFGIPSKDIAVQSVGSTWGSQITKKAITGLIVFLVAVIIYLSFRFEWKMAVAAILALIHDLLITAGLYALIGFEVSPSTVIALLTILGYSLYDTVVVFDKVRENTVGLAGGSRMTYSQAANLAVNQTLVRSINTSIIALLPVAGLLIIGAGLLGAGSLKDLALALFIGLATGAYSSIFTATPIVTDLKEREPAYRQLARRVAARQAKESSTAPLATTAPRWGGGGGGPEPATAPATTGVPLAGDTEPPATRPTPAGPRPGSRPAGPQRRGGRGGRPGGRGGRSRKRR